MESYWNSQTLLGDTVKVPLAASGVTGSIMEVRFSRTVPAGLREDLAQFGFHLTVEAGPGAPMSRLDASDAARVETAFLGKWWTFINAMIANDWILKEIAWRHFGADFPLDKNGLSKPGPYWRVTPVAQAGGSTQVRVPDQLALTTTFRTASRKHWGRFYTGGWTATEFGADTQQGHAKSATCDQLALVCQTFLNDIYDDARKTWVCIWSPKYRGALSINELSVDDTWDIIRSRRAKFPSYRKTYTS